MTVQDSQQVLERLAREGAESRTETAVVTSPGARTPAWAVKIKSHVAYNVYNVRAVVVGDTGSFPIEFGQQMEAVNLAESFLDEGTLSAGTFAVMSRVGDRNVFYAKP